VKRAALYTCVSAFDQNPETQALDLRRVAEQRGFEIVHEYTDRISGAKAKRAGTRPDARRGPPPGVRHGVGLGGGQISSERAAYSGSARCAESFGCRVRFVEGEPRHRETLGQGGHCHCLRGGGARAQP
jgi:hypothetical protein